MIDRHRAPIARVISAAAALLVVAAAPAGAADAVLYRIFLRNGSAIVSYGDFARVGDRVVISVPVGAASPEPTLEVVSIPESVVDWDRTDRYAAAARAKRYADTRGEAEFARLSEEVTQALSRISFTADPEARLAIAETARKSLAEWPLHSYGYRASDVAQLSAVIDEVVSELRVAAGLTRFDVTLVGGTVLPPSEPLLPAPGLRESVELAFVAAQTVAEPAGRVSLLRAIERTLAPLSGRAWTALRARAAADIAREQRLDRAYAQLVSQTLGQADARARRADVRGVQSLVAAVLAADDRLGGARPGTVTSLLATLDGRLDAARRLRLARDAWSLRLPQLRAFQFSVQPSIDSLQRLRPWLEDVRQLAGPSPKSLERLEQRATMARLQIEGIVPPEELDSAKALLVAACRMAATASATRRAAIKSGDMQMAWEASSAAAGALMMLDRALDDLRQRSQPPEVW